MYIDISKSIRRMRSTYSCVIIYLGTKMHFAGLMQTETLLASVLLANTFKLSPGGAMPGRAR